MLAGSLIAAQHIKMSFRCLAPKSGALLPVSVVSKELFLRTHKVQVEIIYPPSPIFGKKASIVENADNNKAHLACFPNTLGPV